MQNPIANGQAKPGKDKRAAGLSSQFFTQLIKLESDIANKTYTAETLDELTQIYAQCVEYYDSVHDNISTYFIFKIQDILATKKSLKLLTEGNNKPNPEPTKQANGAEQTEAEKAEAQANGEASSAPGYKIQVTSANGENAKAAAEHSEEEDDENDDDERMFHRRVTDANKNNRPSRQSITTMKNKKQKLFSLHLKMQDQKANVKQSLQDVMATFGGHSQEVDKTVLKDISVQRRRIQERVENKKRQNLTNYTQNMTAGFLHVKYADDDNKSMESFLKGLEEEEFPATSQINEFNLSSNIMNDNGTEKSKENLSDLKETSIEKKQNEEDNISEPKSEEKPIEAVVANKEQEEVKVAEEIKVVEEVQVVEEPKSEEKAVEVVEVVETVVNEEEPKVSEENNVVAESEEKSVEAAAVVATEGQEEAKAVEEKAAEEVASPSQEVINKEEEAKKLAPQVATQEQAKSPLKMFAAILAAQESDDDEPAIKVKEVATN